MLHLIFGQCMSRKFLIFIDVDYIQWLSQVTHQEWRCSRQHIQVLFVLHQEGKKLDCCGDHYMLVD